MTEQPLNQYHFYHFGHQCKTSCHLRYILQFHKVFNWIKQKLLEHHLINKIDYA